MPICCFRQPADPNVRHPHATASIRYHTGNTSTFPNSCNLIGLRILRFAAALLEGTVNMVEANTTLSFVNTTPANTTAHTTTASSNFDRAMLVFLVVVDILIIFENAAVICVLVAKRTYTTTFYLLIIHICAIDLVYGLYTMPLQFLYFNYHGGIWGFSYGSCTLLWIIYCISMPASDISFALIAGERYMAVCHPVVYRAKKLHKQIYDILVIWGYAAVSGLPVVLHDRIVNTDNRICIVFWSKIVVTWRRSSGRVLWRLMQALCSFTPHLAGAWLDGDGKWLVQHLRPHRRARGLQKLNKRGSYEVSLEW